MFLGKTEQHIKQPAIALAMVVLAVLGVVACGGGSSGSDDLIERNPLSTNTLELALTPTKVSDETPSTLTAKLTDPDGDPVAGQLIRLDAGSKAELSNHRITTDANGEATALVLAHSPGNDELRASFTDSMGSGSASFPYTTSVTVIDDETGEEVTGPDSDSPYALSLSLTDATGQVVGTVEAPITASRTGIARATVLMDGQPVPNKVVTFTTSIGSLSPSQGTALTDAQGVATITLEAGEEEGAGTLTAEIKSKEDQVVDQLGFSTQGGGQGSSGEQDADVRIGSIVSGEFQEGILKLAQSELGVGSSLAITADLVEAPDNNAWSGLAEVSFSSRCSNSGKASFDPVSVLAVSGSAMTSYQPGSGCPADVISASVTHDRDTKIAESDLLDIIPSPANSIEFLGASHEVIGLLGSGQAGAPESSTLRFKVKDGQGEPVSAGKVVDFTVVSGLGGFAITSEDSASTNSEGIAVVTVSSGTVPTVGGVKAALRENPDITATGSVAIQSGIVTQDRFSMAVEELNPSEGDRLGTQVEVTVRAADRFGNWVPDDTQVNFTTELGDIDEGSCKIKGGTCSVTWTSHGLQETQYDSERASRNCFNQSASSSASSRQGLVRVENCGANDRFGRTTIMATAIGEESFNDLNGNNIFDPGEEWVALPEAFRDDNETGLYEDGQEYIDHIFNGVYDDAQGFFRGLGCSPEAKTAGHCDQLAQVRASSRIVLSTDAVQLYAFAEAPPILEWDSEQGGVPKKWGDATLSGYSDFEAKAVSGGHQTLVVVVADANGNAPPVGTEVKLEPGEDLKVFGSDSCTVGNTLEPAQCRFYYTLEDDSSEPPYQSMSVTATAPTGQPKILVIPVTSP